MQPFFFWGATAMACWTIGLIFLRSWRFTGDRFFGLFGTAFWILAIHWTALAVVGAVDGLALTVVTKGESSVDGSRTVENPGRPKVIVYTPGCRSRITY
jgi:hypothetical protein